MRQNLAPVLFSVLIVALMAEESSGTSRPEDTLLRVLGKPFAPTKSSNPSDRCLRDSKIYFDALGNYSVWALQMYDASAKLPSGLIVGNIQQLGNYDECLDTRTGHDFSAQACSASVTFQIMQGARGAGEQLDMKDLLVQIAAAAKLTTVPEYSVDYQWLWCVPSSCDHNEISRALEVALDPLKVSNRVNFTVKVDGESCQTSDSSEDKNTFDILDWSYLFILFAFGCLILISTTVDLVRRNRRDDNLNDSASSQTLLTSFSLYSNGKSLWNTERHGNSIGCIDGIRFMSICWIIYGHSFYQEAVSAKINRISITKLHEDWSSMLFLNGNIVTDTFFLLSGILLSYTTLSKLRKDSKTTINIPSLYVNRYIRLTPVYAIVVGFYATFFDKLGSGPAWNQWVQHSKQQCRSNWWTNLLYINNYVNVDEICMSQTWYVSMDMQLLWISPIFLYPLVRYSRSLIFWAITGLSVIASILVPFFITFYQHLTGTMLYYRNLSGTSEVFLQIYTRVYARAGPYIIGLALGFILYRTRSYKLKIPARYVLLGWILATLATVSVVFLPRFMYLDDYVYDVYEASFYAGLHRHLFALSIAWVILTCSHGYAGPVNTLLSWRAWIPLSRLTYCAYLSHFVILLYRSGIARSSETLTKFGVLHAFLGNLGLTLFVSVILSLCFELPFLVLVRFLFGSSAKGAHRTVKASTESILDNSQMTSSNPTIAANTSNEGSSCSIYTIGRDLDSSGQQPSAKLGKNYGEYRVRVDI